MDDVFGLQIVVVGVVACAVFDFGNASSNGSQRFRRVIGQCWALDHWFGDQWSVSGA